MVCGSLPVKIKRRTSKDWNFSHFVHLTRVQISKLNNRNIILHFFRTYSNRIYFFALHDKNKKNYHFTLLSPLAEIQYTEAGRFHEKSRGSRTWDQNFLLLTSETTYGTVSIFMSFPIFLIPFLNGFVLRYTVQNLDQIDDHFWLLWPLVESNLESYMIFNFSVDVGTEISKFDTQNQQR